MNKRWLFWINGVIILALCLASAPRPAQAVGGVIEVTTTDDEYETNSDTCSLREAVQAVNLGTTFNGCSAGDTIQLGGGETYMLTRDGANNEDNLTGDLDILASLTITSNTSERAIIAGEAGWADRLLDVQTAGITVTISSIFFTGGNVADQGGAIRNNVNATILLDLSVVQDNLASTAGGGLANLGGGSVYITRSIFQYNSAEGSGPASGGLFSLNGGSITMSQAAVLDNHANGGDGGGFWVDGSLTLKNVTISGNTAANYGGGIYVDSGGNVNLNNVTITNNIADSDSNDLGDGGGLLVFQSPKPVFSNTILAGNFDNSASSNMYADCAVAIPSPQSITSQGYNLFGNWTSSGTNCTVNTATGDQKGTASPLNPGLAPLADNGSGRPTHALLGTSLALNAGNPATPTGSGFTCETTDQRGIARSGGRCDVGAFELKYTVFLPLIQR